MPDQEVALNSPEHKHAVEVGLACAGPNCAVSFIEAHGEKVLCSRCHEKAQYHRRYGLSPRAWLEEYTG